MSEQDKKLPEEESEISRFVELSDALEGKKIPMLRGRPLRNKIIQEQEIIDFCKTKLAIYKVPKIIEFRDELPKSAVGKILRKILRDEEVAK